MALRPDATRWLVPLLAASMTAQAAALVILFTSETPNAVRWGALLGLGALVAALGAVALLRRSMQSAQEAAQRALKAEAAAAQARTRLDAALDILPDALAFFDADDRLVQTNASYRAMYAMSAHRLVPGTRFEDILRESVARGEMVEAVGREEDWVQERLAQHRANHSGLLQPLANDRWIRITERPTPDGGVIGLRTEVTEFVRAQRALEQARQETLQAQSLLHEAIEAMPAGFELYDPSDRLVLANQRMAEMRPHLPLAASIGKSYEELLREGLRHGIPVYVAPDAQEDFIAQSMTARAECREDDLRYYPPGRWMRVHQMRTHSGHMVCVRLDVSDLVAQQRAQETAQQEAQQARRLLERALDALPMGLEIFDENDRLVIYNRALTELFQHIDYPKAVGTTFESMLRSSLAQQQIADAVGREEAWLDQRLAQRGVGTVPHLGALADNRWIKTYETRTPEGYTVDVRVDVTDFIQQQQALTQAQTEAQQARAILDDAIEALPEGFALFDAQDRLVVCNSQFRALYSRAQAMIQPGRTFEEILRYGLQQKQYPEALGREEAWLAQRLAQHRAADRTIIQPLPDGRWLQIDERRTPQGGIAGVRADVSELVRKEQELAAANDQLAQLSTTDELTGIANRRRFDEALAHEWQRGARQKDPLSLLMLDIDHFKLYNDHYGHLAGDECLRRVSHLLGGGVRRAGELVARYGGEEFVVLLPSTDLDLAQAIAQRCMQQVREAAIPHGRSPTAEFLTLSIGVACTVPDVGRKPDTLVREADTALYRAKDAGRNRFRTSMA
jgi:diguanylate cyclase (GGDEF)-like protein